MERVWACYSCSVGAMIATKHDEGTRLLELLPRLCPSPCVFHPRCLLLSSFSAFLATYAQVHGGQHDGWLHAFFTFSCRIRVERYSHSSEAYVRAACLRTCVCVLSVFKARCFTNVINYSLRKQQYLTSYDCQIKQRLVNLPTLLQLPERVFLFFLNNSKHNLDTASAINLHLLFCKHNRKWNVLVQERAKLHFRQLY